MGCGRRLLWVGSKPLAQAPLRLQIHPLHRRVWPLPVRLPPCSQFTLGVLSRPGHSEDLRTGQMKVRNPFGVIGEIHAMEQIRPPCLHFVLRVRNLLRKYANIESQLHWCLLCCWLLLSLNGPLGSSLAKPRASKLCCGAYLRLD